ncbi:VCBS repeat-containing protein [Xanthocytophaga flava]|uniref:VCBS repeat-containing protein n=1 Tax=Xanthocytophaga flava TaxID=3048013 RepID=UPI0028D5274F|nr:VCBS repeat-containing protein [Xanthocytophaga flavus]MDJ1472703.1 VCBS repeat-containing protein [Xanthocytophaga flavus]
MNITQICVWILCLGGLLGCNSPQKNTLFTLLPSDHTGITFTNQIMESDTFNALRFEYIYNGGGVGVGDINNDGLQDIFFAGNMVSSKLYLNKGDFHFEDITEKAHINTSYWCTGVAMIDLNQDGLLDIYVSTIHPDKDKKVPNLFFLNKGIDAKGNVIFDEVASQIGLADSSYSTQAAFLDYDRDGDLDMYLLTNSSHENYDRNQAVGQHTDGSGKSVDKLFRNEGIGTNGLPNFKDISKESGIQTEGWGLGIVVNDINRDGYPDIYCANDFLSNDHLWINNCNGTFSNQAKKSFKHTEHNGMGMDIADINNDGLNDIVVMDMMPEDNLRQKTMFSTTGYDRFFLNRRQNYQNQHIRNVLQLNNGNGTFSDIGYLAGIYATDWSWSSLLADFDNDGYRDLLITNGYRKDITDLDFVSYSRDASLFGTDEARIKNAIKAVKGLEGVKKPNCIFHNNGDLTFTNLASEWGLDQPSYSNGAAYADFDNDGDLDLVMNNIDEEAFVYRNNVVQLQKETSIPNTNHFLRIRLQGEKPNTSGLGAKVWVYYDGKIQYTEHEIQRGYKSTIEDYEHFGMGKATKVDSLVVVWQSGNRQHLGPLSTDQVITLQEKNAHKQSVKSSITQSILFEETHSITYKHQETDFPDFKYGQALLSHKHSQQGPSIAVGDVNGDDLDDFIIGGSANDHATIFLQTTDHQFKQQSLPNKTSEDTGILLFDADNDGDNDLYCVSGSSEFGKEIYSYQDRFYRNNGKGIFTLDSTALSKTESSGSCVVACDYDKDGDLDLFVGGRVTPTQYPIPPLSYLLQNDGKGHFVNNTQKLCPELKKPGMVTSALWTDYDNDGWTDLIVTGEFMPITFFHNKQGQRFEKSELPNSGGWWNSITGGDFDNDGDIDYVAGNLGKNSLFQASEKYPVCVYAKDFDQNGTMDPVLCRYIDGKEYISHPRETLTDQIVSFRKTLTSYALYGKSTFTELFDSEKLKDALILKATTFSSAYLENQGKGQFAMHPLPVQAQFSPIFGLLTNDVNNDGNLDILAVGNDYSRETLSGWMDAGTGLYLQGDGKGNFTPAKITETGFQVDGDAKALTQIVVSTNKRLVIATQNQDSVKVFEHPQNKETTLSYIRLSPKDAKAELRWTNGKKRLEEFYYGSGYLSQTTRTLIVPNGVTEVVIFDQKKQSRKEVFHSKITQRSR